MGPQRASITSSIVNSSVLLFVGDIATSLATHAWVYRLTTLAVLRSFRSFQRSTCAPHGFWRRVEATSDYRAHALQLVMATTIKYSERSIPYELKNIYICIVLIYQKAVYVPNRCRKRLPNSASSPGIPRLIHTSTEHIAHLSILFHVSPMRCE